jgi:hypothetical protein
VQASAGMNLQATIWTLAGGYAVLQGDWGDFDVIAGFRYFPVNTRINYSLGLTITGPRGNGATFGGIGSVSGNADIKVSGSVGLARRRSPLKAKYTRTAALRALPAASSLHLKAQRTGLMLSLGSDAIVISMR